MEITLADLRDVRFSRVCRVLFPPFRRSTATRAFARSVALFTHLRRSCCRSYRHICFLRRISPLISLLPRPSSASFHPTQGPSDDHPFTIDVMGEMFEAEKLRGDALRHSADKAVNADYVAEVQTKGMLVRHRRILVEWMMEFSDAFKLNPEVLPLAVNFFDRFLSIHDLEKKKLHLLCMVVLFVASKTAEVHHIMMNELVDATGRVYTSQDVRDLEKDLLSKLDWQMQPVTAYQVRTHTH